VLVVEPDHVDARLECAAERRDRGEFDEARGIINAILAERPDHVPARLQLVQLHRRMGDRDLALHVIEGVLADAPEHVQAMLEAATEYWRLGRPSKAEDLVERALARAPSHLGALLQATDYAVAAEDFERAHALAQRCIAAHPRRVWPYLQAARACVELADEAKAQALLDRAETLCGKQPELVATRIQIARQARDWPTAMAAYAVPRETVQSSFFLWTERFLVALAKGDHALAEQALEEAPATSTKDAARLRLFRAQLREAQRNYAEAVVLYGEALELDPEDGWGHSEMARACLLSLDLDAASQHLRRSVELDEATHVLRGQSLNVSQHHLGQIIDEFAFDREVLEGLRAIRLRPIADQIEPLAELVRRYPENTAPAVILAVALRQAGCMPSGTGDEAVATIPKRIAQYWDSAEPPRDIARMMQSWRRQNPAHIHEIFDDAAAKAFIMQRFPIDVVRAYQRARHPAQRADIFRLAYLSAEGGFYADADDNCLCPLDSFVGPGTTLFLSQENYGTIGNNFMGAVPGHPVIERALALVTEAMNRGDADLLWLSTGPGLLTRAFAHVFVGLVPDAGDWLRHAIVREFSDLQRDVACHCPARYKRTDRHWSRRSQQRSVAAARG
jgi:tetratricopeptide (TPR) repeat protein